MAGTGPAMTRKDASTQNPIGASYFARLYLLTKGHNGEILSTGFCGSHFIEGPEPIFADAYRLSTIRADAAKTVQNQLHPSGVIVMNG
jgi:hypothetical protein